MKKHYYIIAILALITTTLFAQKTSINGIVTDEKNETVIGATVVLENTTIGAVTDINGKYIINNLEPGKVNVVFSMVGFKKQKHEVTLVAGQSTKLDIIIKEDILQLEQVVVVGYGNKEKRDITGSIETIKAKELLESGNHSFENVMQGRASGVQVTAANGVAGAPVKVKIRGTSSISAGSEPLYVVDGIPISSGDFSSGGLGSGTNALSDLNPNDIESMEILKDAASAAIYGSRGANGVVIITTKKGKAGKTVFNASYNAGIINETNRLKLLSAQEMLNLRDRASAEKGLAPEPKTNTIYGSWTRAQADSLAALGGTDWIDKVLQNGILHEANVSASGGNDKTIFYIGGTYHNETGFLVGNKFQRANGRVNLENKATKQLTLGSNIGLTYSINDRVPIGDAGGLGDAQRMFPYLPVKTADNQFFYPEQGGYPGNPVWALENKKYKAKSFRTVSNVWGDYEFTKNLHYRSEFGVDVMNQDEDEFDFRNTQNPNSVSSAWNRRTSVFNWTTNNFLTYNLLVKEKHDMQFTLGNAIQRAHTDGAGLNGWDFPNDFYTTPNASSATNKTGYYYSTGYAFVSNFLRANYKFNNKYIFSFSLRNDGSSRFGSKNRYGWFPALSGAWIISDENFLVDNKILSFLKFRSSYGMTGNANIGDFAYLGVYYPTSGYNGQMAVVPGTLENSNLSWEKSAQLDVTLDYGFMNNKIAGSFTYYNKATSDMLLYVSIPTSSGYSNVLQNIGKMKNYGYELTINTKNINKKFKWSTDFNIAFNFNKVLDVNNLPPDAFESGQPGEGRVVVGYPVGQAYLVKYAGVQKQNDFITVYDVEGNEVKNADGTTKTALVLAGQDIYYDKHGNKMVANYFNQSGALIGSNADFYEHRVPCGSPIPLFIGGITNSFSYKNFDFSFLVSFVYGNTLYDDPAKSQIGSYDKIAQRPEIKDAWTVDNPNTDVPALNLYRPTNSDRFLYDASFVRLRSISLGYRLPVTLSQKFYVDNLRVFVSATNLYTLTKYPGWDPEVLRNVDTNSQQGNISFAGPSLQTPQARVISGGIQIQF